MVGKAMKSNAVAAPGKVDRKIAKRDSEHKVGKSAKKQKLGTANDYVSEKKISEAANSEEDPASKSEQDFKGKKYAEKSEEKEVKTSDGQKPCPNTLFIGNLSYDISEDNIKEFFKHAGKIIDVRLAKDRRGRSKGLGHVEFADEAAAQMAMEKNKEELMGREINLEFAREKGANTSKGTSWTIFVTGFDKLQELQKIQKSLKEYFGSCGRIMRVSTPTDSESGGSKGIAYLDFKDQAAFSKALKLNKTKMGDCTLAVAKAKPKSDSQGDSFGGRGGRRGGGHGRGRRGGRGDGGGHGRGGGDGRGRGGSRGWFDRPAKREGKHVKFD